MPGYLYSRNKFQDLFIYDEYNANNLRKLIKPFILRRTKSQVMTELPDKIENKFSLSLININEKYTVLMWKKLKKNK